MQAEIYNTKKEQVGTLDLPDEVFSVSVNEALLWEQVKSQRACRRRGTHSTLSRNEVRGGGAKPYRQKGTGRARQGSSRSPVHVGGGIAFGPKPRDYAYRLPRSARRSALRSALSQRVLEKHVVVLKDFDLETPKTKEVSSFLERFELKSALMVDVENIHLKKSFANVPGSKFLAAAGLNVYDILNHEHLVVTEKALPIVIDRAKAKSTNSGTAENAGGAS